MSDFREKDRRRLSLEKDFMNYKTDDLLYAQMLSIASAEDSEVKGKYKLYLPISVFYEKKGDIMKTVGINIQRTLDNHMKKLEEIGLIKQEIFDDQMVYRFPFDYDGKYKLVNKELLYYISSTKSKNSVRTYVFLLNKFLGKKKENDTFVFTNKDIIEALGYSKTTKTASNTVSMIIDDLNKRGIIKTVDFYEEVVVNDKPTPVPKQRLLFVATTIDEMEKRYIEKAYEVVAEDQEKKIRVVVANS